LVGWKTEGATWKGILERHFQTCKSKCTNQSRRVKNINTYTCTLKFSKIIERKTKNVQNTKPKRKFFIEKNNFYVHIKTNVVTNTLTIWTLRVSILTYFFAMNSKQKQLKRQNNYAINVKNKNKNAQYLN
jgi:hypothetical protein